MEDEGKPKHPIMGVGVIIVRNGKVLLGRRRGPRRPGDYGLPGGLLENTESLEMCARREVFEETGLKDFFLDPVTSLRWNDGVDHYIDIIFYANCSEGNPTARESDRVEGWQWFDLDELPSPLYPPTKMALQRFITDQQLRRSSLFLRKWAFRRKRIILFEDKPEPHLGI